MHTLFAIALILASGTLLVVGLLGTLRHLLDRAPSPVLEGDGLAWSSRYRGVAAAVVRTDLNRT